MNYPAVFDSDIKVISSETPEDYEQTTNGFNKWAMQLQQIIADHEREAKVYQEKWDDVTTDQEIGRKDWPSPTSEEGEERY